MTAFMVPFVTQETFLVVENTHGETFPFPADVCERSLSERLRDDMVLSTHVDVACTCLNAHDCCDACTLAQYVEGTPRTVQRVSEKYWARLSAPGYLDATDWDGPHDTEEAAKHALSEQYDVCSECGEDMDEQEGDTCASCKGEDTEEGD